MKFLLGVKRSAGLKKELSRFFEMFKIATVFPYYLTSIETVAAFKSKTDKNKAVQISSRLQDNFQAGAPGM